MDNEGYRPQPMAANSSYHVAASHMGGFLATVAGTLTVTAKNSTDGSDVVVVDTLPVAVGFNRIPLVFNTPEGAVVQLAGGAAGTLLI